MTKRKLFVLFSLLGIACYIWVTRVAPSPTIIIKDETPKSKVTIPNQTSQVSKTEVVKSQRSPASMNPVNMPTQEWRSNLKDNLVTQGGSFIKEIHITKERTFTFTKDRTPLNAHTVKIDLKNQNDEASSFRAIVDASTGKILETYDRTQFDQIGHNRKPASFKAQPVFQ